MMEDKLPKGWTFRKIGDLSEQINGKAFKPSDWSNKGTPIIRIQNLNNFKADFNYSENIIDEKFHVYDGDLLFAWSGTPGTSFGAHIWNRGKAYLNQHIFKIKIINDQLNQSYYYYALKITVEKFIIQAQGTAGLAHITKKKFENTEIPLPPIPEQQRIVAKLDALFGHLDSLREKLDGIPALLKNFRQQVLTQAVTGELTKAKMSIVSLGEYLEDIKYGTSKKSEFGLDGTPILRIPNIEVDKGLISNSDLKYSQLDDKEYEKLKLRLGDILIIRSNGSVSLVGQSAIIQETEEGYGYAGYLVRLRTSEGLLPKFLNYMLKSNYLRSQIVETARSTSGVNNINSTEIKSLKIPITSLENQKAIVERIELLFNISDKIESQYQILKAKVDQLPQAILAKAFRGELVGQVVKEYVVEEREGLMAAEGKKEYGIK
ncbi:restriction endonuclease subunit S [Pleomorphovibrio marinus]|uniref:restriction endonuclease subunit S n=1 Tax=Pleomorphovibrio marinus TaxID=2164132 RepID=UPI000E0B27AA|nr:restriction endonuclease subunit S [Pleomorphovibrio marinus]